MILGEDELETLEGISDDEGTLSPQAAIRYLILQERDRQGMAGTADRVGPPCL